VDWPSQGWDRAKGHLILKSAVLLVGIRAG